MKTSKIKIEKREAKNGRKKRKKNGEKIRKKKSQQFFNLYFYRETRRDIEQ